MSIYRFADLTVEMSPRFSLLSERAEKYLVTPEENDGITDADIVIGAPPEAISPEYSADAEYMYAGGVFYRRLLSLGGMMLHSSAVVYNDRAYLFTAPPGTGKSTHTQGWVDALGGRAVVINDDKPAIIRRGGVYFACGTPFSGTSPQNENIIAPIGAVVILSRSSVNSIERVSPSFAVPKLYEQTIRRLSPSDARRMLDMLVDLASTVPIFSLGCTIGRDAVRCSFEALTGETLSS